MVASFGIEDSRGELIISRQKECALGVFEIDRFDVLIEFVQIDGFMALIANTGTVGDLREEHQLSVAPAGLQVAAIQPDFNPGHEPLMKGKLGTRDASRKVKVRLGSLSEPLIEFYFFKRRIKRAALAGRLGHEDSGQ